MNRQRKVLITITYNEMGIIIDTKAEEVAQPNLQSTCNELATDCISRQAAIDALDCINGAEEVLKALPSVQPDQRSFSCGQENDMISRQDAIEAILAVTGNSSVRELYEHVQEHGLSDMWSGGVNAAIDIIIAVPSAQPEQRWIPCSERLPDEYGEYLVTKRTIGWNCEEYNSIDIAYFDNDGFHKAYKVLAWMPLPEPYQTERREE